MLQGIMQDIRYGLRLLSKNPGFTAVAVLSLALGIGANTAIFTLINAVLLRSLPVHNPQELVSLNLADVRNGNYRRWTDGNSNTAFPYPTYEQMRDRNQVFSSLFAFKVFGRLTVQVNGDAELARGQFVTANYFPSLGVRPILGHGFAEEDGRADADPVAVISHGYWQRRFGGDPGVIRKKIALNGVPFTISGVTPAEFFGLQAGSAIDVSMPFAMQPRILPEMSDDADLFKAGDRFWIEIMGRVKPGVTEEQARTNLDVIYRQSMLAALQTNDGKAPVLSELQVVPGGQGLQSLRKQFSKPLFILMTVVAVVLLIACANVANLLLARATARRKEIAVRLSIGASRSRLVRQLLVESLLLSALGGVAGLLFAYWGSNLLVAMMQSGNNRLALDLRPDLTVLAFTAAACLLTGILFGLAPAFRATRVDLTPALKQSAANAGGGRERMRMTKTLVVSQVALSLVLLFGAALFVRTLVNLQNQNVGFTKDNLLLFGIDPRQAGYRGQRFSNLCRDIQDKLSRLPGVRSATASLHLLLTGGSRSNRISVPGYTPAPKEGMSVMVMPVGANFLSTMEIPLVMGRDLTARDDENAPKVALINETMARRYWPGRNPLGRHFTLSKLDLEIVGVVKDARYDSLRRDIRPVVYHPFVQDVLSMPHMHFEVRAAGDAAALIPSVRQVVASSDQRLPIFDLKTQTQQVDELLLQERLFAKLTGFFAVLALALVCVGLHGIMSYAVARRTSEIGIRMALGAQRWDILAMVVREVMLLIGIGVVLGIAGSFATAKYAATAVSGLLFGLQINDFSALTFAALLIFASGIFAGFFPARRASRVDPIIALRDE